MEKNSQIPALDALRGIAAIVVVLGHFFFGFAPQFHGLQYQGSTGVGVAGTPFFAIFNGTAAVIFFFVLSGFVLSIKPLQTRSYISLIRSVIKRWPRLAGPVMISCVISAALALLSLYYNHEAAMISGSQWLDSFQFRLEGRSPSYFDAIWEGAVLTFFTGSHAYNAVLWTMWYEFLGSFIVFGIVALLIPLRKKSVRLVILFSGWWLVLLYQPFLSCFLIGAILAEFHVQGKWQWFHNNRFSGVLSLISFVVVILIWGYQGPYKFYEFVGGWFSDTITSKILVYTVAAILLMVAGLYNHSVRKRLSNRMGTILGQMSFPIYLVHLLVICSISSWFYVEFSKQLSDLWAVAFVFALTCVVTAGSAWLLMKIDQMLTRKLNGYVNRSILFQNGNDDIRLLSLE